MFLVIDKDSMNKEEWAKVVTMLIDSNIEYMVTSRVQMAKDKDKPSVNVINRDDVGGRAEYTCGCCGADIDANRIVWTDGKPVVGN